VPSEDGWTAIAEEMERAALAAHRQLPLRDWCISRQRYWGRPSIIYCESADAAGAGGPAAGAAAEDVRFTGSGESPLTTSAAFINTTARNAVARRGAMRIPWTPS